MILGRNKRCPLEQLAEVHSGGASFDVPVLDDGLPVQPLRFFSTAPETPCHFTPSDLVHMNFDVSPL
jgi:hypothetical protein